MKKYSDLSDHQLALLNQNIINIVGEIDNDTAMEVLESIIQSIAKGSPALKIIITSEGGSLEAGLQIYDIIRQYPGKTTGIVWGYACSSALIILQACNKRLATQSSYIRMHPSSRVVQANVLKDKILLQQIIQQLDKLDIRICQIYSLRTKKKIEEIGNMLNRQLLMEAKQALAENFIDGITSEETLENHP